MMENFNSIIKICHYNDMDINAYIRKHKVFIETVKKTKAVVNNAKGLNDFLIDIYNVLHKWFCYFVKNNIIAKPITDICYFKSINNIVDKWYEDLRLSHKLKSCMEDLNNLLD